MFMKLIRKYKLHKAAKTVKAIRNEYFNEQQNVFNIPKNKVVSVLKEIPDIVLDTNPELSTDYRSTFIIDSRFSNMTNLTEKLPVLVNYALTNPYFNTSDVEIPATTKRRSMHKWFNRYTNPEALRELKQSLIINLEEFQHGTEQLRGENRARFSYIARRTDFIYVETCTIISFLITVAELNLKMSTGK